MVEVRLGDDAAAEHQDVVGPALLQGLDHGGEERVVRAAHDGEADRVDVFLNRRRCDHVGGLVQARVDDLEAGVTQRASDHLGAPVVPVEARLGDQDTELARFRCGDAHWRAKRYSPACSTSKGASLAGLIRSARPPDALALLSLIRALARYERLEHEVVGTEEDLREHLFGAHPRAEVALVEEDGGEISAFALYFHNYSTFLCKPGLYLEDLFVLPEHRRKGYGSALLRHLAKVALARGCGRFEWSVLEWNEPAIAFYRSLGARMLDDWRILRVTGDALHELAAK